MNSAIASQPDPKDLAQLVEASASIGADPMLVQGGGGNSSLKTDTVLVVKASGFWLRDASDKQMFVALDLAGSRQRARAGGETFGDLVLRNLPGGDLRPSIETGLHALLPHRFVMHAHPANAIASTLTPSLRGAMADRLSGLKWALVDYVKPGADLAMAVARAVEANNPDILIFVNHGAVAGGATAAEAAERLREVERRLATARAAVPPAPVASKDAPTGYRWLADAVAAGMASDPALYAKLTIGAIVPDQVVYLGGPACVVDRIEDVSALSQAWLAQRGVAPGLVFVAGQGALVRDDLSPGGLSMIPLLCEIALRLPKEEQPATIGIEAELSLLNWDAEKYRQAVDKARV